MSGPTQPTPASSGEIMACIRHYGRRRLLFGSGVPFGHPVSELEKILCISVDESVKEDICGKNLPRLYARIRPADAETR